METKIMTVGNLLATYGNVGKHIPQEVLELECGSKLYDKKYLKIKEFLKQCCEG